MDKWLQLTLVIVASQVSLEAVGFIPGVAFALAALAHVDVLEGNKTKAQERLESSRKMLEALGSTSRVA